jgi:hypothetical protein
MQFQKLRTVLRSYNGDDLLPVKWKAPYFDTAANSVCLQSRLTCYILQVYLLLLLQLALQPSVGFGLLILQVHSNVYSAVRISFGLIIYNHPIGHDDG